MPSGVSISMRVSSGLFTAFPGEAGEGGTIGGACCSKTDASHLRSAKQPAIQYASCKKRFFSAPDVTRLANGVFDALHLEGLLFRISP